MSSLTVFPNGVASPGLGNWPVHLCRGKVVETSVRYLSVNPFRPNVSKRITTTPLPDTFYTLDEYLFLRVLLPVSVRAQVNFYGSDCRC